MLEVPTPTITTLIGQEQMLQQPHQEVLLQPVQITTLPHLRSLLLRLLGSQPYWTGTDVTTTTSSVVLTGTDNNPTTSRSLFVETPESAITTYWTKLQMLQQPHQVLLQPVQITTLPSPSLLGAPESQYNTYWTGTDVTTAHQCCATGTDNNPTSPIVVVETPESTIATYWTGTMLPQPPPVLYPPVLMEGYHLPNRR